MSPTEVVGDPTPNVVWMNFSLSACDLEEEEDEEEEEEEEVTPEDEAGEVDGVELSVPHPNVVAASVLIRLASRLKPPAPIISATPLIRDPDFGINEEVDDGVDDEDDEVVEISASAAAGEAEAEAEVFGRRTGIVRVPRRSPATMETGTEREEGEKKKRMRRRRERKKIEGDERKERERGGRVEEGGGS